MPFFWGGGGGGCGRHAVSLERLGARYHCPPSSGTGGSIATIQLSRPLSRLAKSLVATVAEKYPSWIGAPVVVKSGRSGPSPARREKFVAVRLERLKRVHF